MRKNLFLLLLFPLLVVACMPQDPYEVSLTIPQDIPVERDTMKTLLSEAQDARTELEDFIEKLEAELDRTDTTKVRRTSVVAVRPIKEDFKHYSDIQANVQADDPHMASAEMGGRLIHMPWLEGQSIRKGQVVGRVDMESVDKQVAELEKRLELARTVYDRQKRLWDQNIGSEMQYLQAKNNMESLQKSIEAVRFQSTKAEIYAPATGVIDMVMIKQGEMAGPGSPIIMIMNTSKVKVVAGVPEKYLKSVKRGQKVTVKFPSIEEERTATVSQIGRTVNPANRTFDVEVTMSNPGNILKPNLLATMMINDETIKDAIMVSDDVIRQDVAGLDYVYVVDKDEEGDIARKKYITPGSSFEGMTVISDGLEGDELIIGMGGRGLSEGQAIEVDIQEETEETKGSNG